MYLVDTNVWLERMLDQEQAQQVGLFLGRVPSRRLCLTDFALHSIGITMLRLKVVDGYLRFIRDAFIDGGVQVVHLEPADMLLLVEVAEQYHLDYDDAYQYVAAQKYGLTLVSFDGDFDRTQLGRITPSAALAAD